MAALFAGSAKLMNPGIAHTGNERHGAMARA